MLLAPLQLSRNLRTLLTVVPILWVGNNLQANAQPLPQRSVQVNPAPIVPAANDTRTIVTPRDRQFLITGGAVSSNGANLFHSFQQFNLGANQTANFVTSPQIQNVLSRVQGNNPSVINGLIQVSGSNANLFLINPAGIIFGNNASLNVPASFTATTATSIGFGNNNWLHSLENNYAALNGIPSEFLFANPRPGSIINTGNLSLTPGQNLNLWGGTVLNTGNLTSRGGNITLMAVPGTSLVRISQPGHVLSLEIDTTRLAALRQGDNGNPSPSLANSEQFTPLSLPELLTGASTSATSTTSTPLSTSPLSTSPLSTSPLSTSPLRTNPLRTSGQEVTGLNFSNSQWRVAGERIPLRRGSAIIVGREGSSRINVSGALGGNVRVLGDRTLLVNSRINASGTNGGGNVLIGGDYRGQGTIPTATRTYIDRNSVINADSLLSGQGGRVIVWADQLTAFYGLINARGAVRATVAPSLLANGGFVEVSGGEALIYRGRVDLSAAYGNFGTLVLDPKDIKILSGDKNDDLDVLDADLSIADLLNSKLPELYRHLFTISQENLETESLYGNIILEATNNITIEPLRQNRLDFRGGIANTISFIADSDRDGNGSFTMQGNDTIFTGGADLIIRGANINLYRVNTTYAPPASSTREVVTSSINTLRGFSNSENRTPADNAGSINLQSSQELIVRGGLDTSSTRGAGGRIEARGDRLEIRGGLDTTSITGAGGAITLTSQLNLNIANASTPLRTSLDTSSQTGSAGAIRLNSSLGTITTGDLQASSQTGTGGLVSLAALGNLTIGSINTSSVQGEAGAVGLSSQQGGVTVRQINTSSNQGSGGAIDLSVSQGIVVGNLNSSSNGANGGNITLSSQQENLRTGALNSSSNQGGGGSVDLSSRAEIITQGINTTSTRDRGGNILLTSQAGGLNTERLDARGQTSGLITLNAVQDIFNLGGIFSGSGGGITLSSGDGGINTGLLSTRNNGDGAGIQVTARRLLLLGAIDSQGDTSGTGGSINLQTLGNIRILNTFRTASIPNASIASGGGLGGGSITLNYGGDRPLNPFTIGNAGLNGTEGAITNGSINLSTSPNQVITTGLIQGDIRINAALFVPPPTPRPPRPPRPTPTPTPTPTATPTPTPTPTPTATPTPRPPRRPRPPRPTPPPLEQAPRTPEIQTNSATSTSTSLEAAPEIRQINNLATRVANEKAVGALEENFSREYSSYLNFNNPVGRLSLAETKQILGNIESNTGVRSALLYVAFTDSSTSTTSTTSSSLSTSPQGINQTNQTKSQAGEKAESPHSQLEVMIVTAQGDIIRRRVPESNRALVLRTAQELRSQVTNIRNPRAFLNSSQQIYNWLIAPIDAELQQRGVKNLVFIMDGGMRSLPLAALHDGQNFIIDRYSVGMTPSLNLTSTGYRDLRHSQVLAMGAAIFTDADQSPLPAVPVELALITNQLGRGNYFLNSDFTFNNLQTQVQQRNLGIIHLATHASFLSGDASKSYIQLWDSQLRLDQLQNMGWNNPQVDLLVLSACQTAMGDRQAELGFGGVAVKSGVRSAIASLWQVSDEGTLGLMTQFYQALTSTPLSASSAPLSATRQSPIKAEALRQAQLAMQRGEVRIQNGELITQAGRFPLPPELTNFRNQDFTHPYYWSAFTMIGSPW